MNQELIMTSKKLIKAFIAGMAFPAFALPIIYTLMFFKLHSVLTRHMIQFIPMFLPLVWGLANCIFVKMHKPSAHKRVNRELMATGASLGFLVAVFGVFVARIPAMMLERGSEWQYAPLIIVPILYALFFRYIVKWLNKLLEV